MTDSLLATSDPLKVASMKAEFHADRARNHQRRAAIAKAVTVLCFPLTWWRIYVFGRTLATLFCRPSQESEARAMSVCKWAESSSASN